MAEKNARWPMSCEKCVFIAQDGEYDVWLHQATRDNPTWVLRTEDRREECMPQDELLVELTSDRPLQYPFDLLLKYADV